MTHTAGMEPNDSRESGPLQGSFERELEKIFFALRGADRTGLRRNYYSGVGLFFSTLCFNTSGDDMDKWLSVEFTKSDST